MHLPLLAEVNLGRELGDTVKLAIIFCFVIVIIAINSLFRWQRHKLWHDTARLALEKGQPMPPAPMDRRDYQGRGSSNWDLRRGLVLIAIGGAFYFALPDHARNYSAIPAFIGVALVLFGLFNAGRPDKSPDQRDQPGKQ